MNDPTGLHTFPWLIGVTIPDLNFVHRHVPEVMHHAVSQSVSGSQHNDQHEDSP
mgnify:CR=1 FL=1